MVPDKKKLDGKVILVAEDDEFSFELINIILSEAGATVLHAQDGKKAIDIFNSTHLDLLLLDIRLPELSGYEIVKTVREKNKNIPVIAQTAYSRKEDRKTCIDAGFNDQLTKPVSAETLLNIVSSYLFS
jgi:CheY-like chemotaxis protein